eukprot:CAMPEP_0119317202 /NCGR_PEP_ID=MMETSP1333-20130426/42315_1 /TAXON_ID=418940 /ORGANISM="Scyphosphaera apsteinii, Strain RCC1455" /LENGTH=369 /DNA_ID=CAMNT_0007323069 /DNA_START=103 /DNA_END=1212 /DNA_ORIENTATION=+
MAAERLNQLLKLMEASPERALSDSRASSPSPVLYNTDSNSLAAPNSQTHLENNPAVSASLLMSEVIHSSCNLSSSFQTEIQATVQQRRGDADIREKDTSYSLHTDDQDDAQQPPANDDAHRVVDEEKGSPALVMAGADKAICKQLRKHIRLARSEASDFQRYRDVMGAKLQQLEKELKARQAHSRTLNGPARSRTRDGSSTHSEIVDKAHVATALGAVPKRSPPCLAGAILAASPEMPPILRMEGVHALSEEVCILRRQLGRRSKEAQAAEADVAAVKAVLVSLQETARLVEKEEQCMPSSRQARLHNGRALRDAWHHNTTLQREVRQMSAEAARNEQLLRTLEQDVAVGMRAELNVLRAEIARTCAAL